MSCMLCGVQHILPGDCRGVRPQVATADAPRPRGKRHSVKPWREEVAEIIDAKLAAAIEAEFMDTATFLRLVGEEVERQLAARSLWTRFKQSFYVRVTVKP